MPNQAVLISQENQFKVNDKSDKNVFKVCTNTQDKQRESSFSALQKKNQELRKNFANFLKNLENSGSQ